QRRSIALAGASLWVGLVFAAGQANDQVRSLVEPFVELPLLEIRLECALGNALSNGIRYNVLHAVAGLYGYFALVQRNQYNEAIVVFGTTHPPALTQFGGILVGIVAANRLHRHNSDLGRGGVV